MTDKKDTHISTKRENAFAVSRWSPYLPERIENGCDKLARAKVNKRNPQKHLKKL